MNYMSNTNIASQVKEYIILFANKLIINALYIVNNSLLKTAIILFVVCFIHISDNNDYRYVLHACSIYMNIKHIT